VLADHEPLSTVLKAVQTVVADYENLVRHYPASAYCDDSLWRAAKLSADAFAALGDPRERTAAARLFKSLAARYPTSRLARQVPTQLARLDAEDPGPFRPAAAPEPRGFAPDRSAGSKLATIKSIRREVLPDVVRIVIDLDIEVPFHDERLENPPRVFVDLPSTHAVASLIDRTIRFDSDADVVRQVRIGRHPNRTTRVVLDAGGVTTYSVYPLYSPYRLVIECSRALPVPAAFTPIRPVADATRVPLLRRRLTPDWAQMVPAHIPTAAAALREASRPEPLNGALPASPVDIGTVAPVAPTGAPSKNLAGGFSLARQLGLGVSRIVIDPGHGGHDPGARAGGLSEAELVLDIALRLEKLLARVPGVDVVLTRRTDDYVALQERTAIANREGADLFLSIHANASGNRQARGIETYFLNFATSLSTAAVAARENAASGQTMGALPDVVKTIALNNKLDESRDFATFVQRAMIDKVRGANKTVRDLGVKQAPFVVLIGAAMPSVLAEISFLTNVQEAKLLKGSAYRQRIADALFDAVRKYQVSLKSVPTIAQRP
jgi:N-acetylmuramoyl-L-alanine amidase